MAISPYARGYMSPQWRNAPVRTHIIVMGRAVNACLMALALDRALGRNANVGTYRIYVYVLRTSVSTQDKDSRALRDFVALPCTPATQPEQPKKEVEKEKYNPQFVDETVASKWEHTLHLLQQWDAYPDVEFAQECYLPDLGLGQEKEVAWTAEALSEFRNCHSGQDEWGKQLRAHQDTCLRVLPTYVWENYLLQQVRARPTIVVNEFDRITTGHFLQLQSGNFASIRWHIFFTDPFDSMDWWTQLFGFHDTAAVTVPKEDADRLFPLDPPVTRSSSSTVTSGSSPSLKSSSVGSKEADSVAVTRTGYFVDLQLSTSRPRPDPDSPGNWPSQLFNFAKNAPVAHSGLQATNAMLLGATASQKQGEPIQSIRILRVQLMQNEWLTLKTKYEDNYQPRKPAKTPTVSTASPASGPTTSSESSSASSSTPIAEKILSSEELGTGSIETLADFLQELLGKTIPVVTESESNAEWSGILDAIAKDPSKIHIQFNKQALQAWEPLVSQRGNLTAYLVADGLLSWHPMTGKRPLHHLRMMHHWAHGLASLLSEQRADYRPKSFYPSLNLSATSLPVPIAALQRVAWEASLMLYDVGDQTYSLNVTRMAQLPKQIPLRYVVEIEKKDDSTKRDYPSAHLEYQMRILSSPPSSGGYGFQEALPHPSPEFDVAPDSQSQFSFIQPSTVAKLSSSLYASSPYTANLGGSGAPRWSPLSSPVFSPYANGNMHLGNLTPTSHHVLPSQDNSF